jgi:hypothetical protein
MAYTAEAGRRFWYEFDARTKYDWETFGPIMAQAGAGGIQGKFNDARIAGRYPGDFERYVSPRRASWVAIAGLQRQVIAAHFGDDMNDLQLAFEDFGQGVLLDTARERVDNDDPIHTMDTGASPPEGYHRWHASIRAIQIAIPADRAWWDGLDRLVALAWAIQSLQRPRQLVDRPNPPMAQADLAAVRGAWRDLAPDRVDRQYDLGTGTFGYHPDPMNPVP